MSVISPRRIKDELGRVIELHCTYDPETKSGSGFSCRKVKGTIHWVSADKGLPCTIRLYEPLFIAQPRGDNLLEYLNPNSLQIMDSAVIEPAVFSLLEEGFTHFQFIRQGFFYPDKTSQNTALIFNRVVPLKSSYKPTSNEK